MAERTLNSLLSPQPRQVHFQSHPTRKNPFSEPHLPPIKPQNPREKDLIFHQIQSILTRPVCPLPPISKKTPSPSFSQKLPLPKRLTTNPIVHDEHFQELETNASSTSSLI